MPQTQCAYSGRHSPKSWKRFAECVTHFSFSQKILPNLQAPHINTRIKTQAQFTEILTQRSVIPSLNALDTLIADAKLRKAAAETNNAGAEVPVPPHMLPPRALLDAHLAPFLEAQAVALTARLAELRGENGELARRLEMQRVEMEGLVAAIEAVVRDLEGAAGMVQGGEWSGLGVEVRALEKEIAGV